MSSFKNYVSHLVYPITEPFSFIREARAKSSREPNLPFHFSSIPAEAAVRVRRISGTGGVSGAVLSRFPVRALQLLKKFGRSASVERKYPERVSARRQH